MTDTDRIPAVLNASREAMDDWFRLMADRALLFHPDDPPQSIEDINTGARIFTDRESRELERTLDNFFDKHGTVVYDLALYHAQRRLGIPHEGHVWNP